MESRRGPKAKVPPIMKKVAGEGKQKKLSGVRDSLRKEKANGGGWRVEIRERKEKAHAPRHHFFVNSGAQREQSSRAGKNVWEPAGA